MKGRGFGGEITHFFSFSLTLVLKVTGFKQIIIVVIVVIVIIIVVLFLF